MADSIFTIPINQQIKLTPILPTDKGAFLQLLNDSFIIDRTLMIPSPYLEQHFEEFSEISKQNSLRYQEPINFVIRDQNETAIGGCGFNSITPGHKAVLGYWLGKEFRGQGIMTATVKALKDHLIQRWEIARIEAYVFVGNQPSAHVLLNNGFQLEGTLRKHHKKGEQFIDAELYAWIKED